ncbi:MAG TPA: CARDB domain-containing protein, partial [Xanthomonadales bacterium]|nr:CARDB domain-containing protein [Xanthomonadales bacterium]
EGDPLVSQIEFNIDVDGTWILWASTFELLDTFDYQVSVACENVPVTDMAVTSIEVQPSLLDLGQEYTITAELENLGTIASESTTLRYYLSQDDVLEMTDLPLGTDPVGPLQGGDSTVDNITVNAPNAEGVFWVGACLDEVEMELSTENNCSEAVQITIDSGEPDENIAITAGINDAWFNQATDGQGFFFNVFPGLDQMFVGWFTFDEPAAATESSVPLANIGGDDQRWLTAFGTFATSIANLTLYNTSGGEFNSAEPAATEMEDGTFAVSFSSCRDGLVTFSNTTSGLSGDIPIQRISDDNVALCEELSGSNPSTVLTTLDVSSSEVLVNEMFTVTWTTDGATECTPNYGTGGWDAATIDATGGNMMLSSNEPGLHVFDLTCSNVAEEVTRRTRVLVTEPQTVPEFQISEGLNDAWFNPDTSGQGFFINVFPGRKEMFLSWFTYDTERPEGSDTEAIGEPGHRWFTAFGPYDQNSAELDLQVTTGGVFNAAPPNPQTVTDGSISVEFIDCENAIVDFNIESAELNGEVMIRRISGDNRALCDDLSLEPDP